MLDSALKLPCKYLMFLFKKNKLENFHDAWHGSCKKDDVKFWSSVIYSNECLEHTKKIGKQIHTYVF